MKTYLNIVWYFCHSCWSSVLLFSLSSTIKEQYNKGTIRFPHWHKYTTSTQIMEVKNLPPEIARGTFLSSNNTGQNLTTMVALLGTGKCITGLRYCEKSYYFVG